jgi:nucleotide-binding universal stress UspA family protein
MFTRIVVPLDGTRFAEAALAPARELARVFGAHLLLVRAVPPHGLPPIVDGDGYQSDLERANDADAYLHTMTERARQAGYDAGLALALTAPGKAIAQYAALEQADLVVMATHVRWKAPVSHAGSATLDVLVRSRVPLLAWRAEAGADSAEGRAMEEPPPPLARSESPLIVPLDGSPLAETALPYAEALARALGLYIVLVCAVSQPKLVDESRRYLERLQAGMEQRGVPARTTVETGEPLHVIETTWRQNDGSLIVMASRGRPGPFGTLFGSLAAHLIEEVEASVLVVQQPHDVAAEATPDEALRGTMAPE